MGIHAIDHDTHQKPALHNLGEIIEAMHETSRAKFRTARLSLVVADALMLGLGFVLAYMIRFTGETATFFDPLGVANVVFYSTYIYVLIPVWLLIFNMLRLYDTSVLFSGHQEYMLVFNGCTFGIMVIIVITFLDTTLEVARAWLVLAWLLTFFFVSLSRFTARRIIYGMRRRGHFMSPTYIVGANDEGIAIAEQLSNVTMTGVSIIGFLDDEPDLWGEEALPGLVVHGATDKVEELVQRFGVERIIVATSGIHRKNMLDLFRKYMNSEEVSIWLTSGMYEILTTGVRLQDVGSVPMVSINRLRLTGLNVVLKAMLDYVGATLGLIILAPFFLLIAIIMKLTDPGPVFYPRRVVGVGGVEFDAFKFRTMVVNSQEVLDELLANDPDARAEYEKYFKLKKDPRITRVGNFLRRTSVDELPQLFNVLRGQMSLVGPRMITMEEVQRYGQWGLNLHSVKPGITGLWQTSGRSELTYEERVRLDMSYIRNYSIWLDLQIIFTTIPAVLMSKGAY
ncbi:MAG: sugar transferase [Anaerolineaceae bacterium]|nr:sugar transferase [Anaerolineaceae bacterium]